MDDLNHNLQVDDALTLPRDALTHEELHHQIDLASVWMNRGIALLNARTSASLTESLLCFDEAIKLRREMPLNENHWLRYGLIAGWMNRGDALTRMGTADRLAEAARSYDEALALLRDLPMHENPLFRQRLAIAWMNRGITFQALGTATCLVEAVKSYDESISALPALRGSDDNPDHVRISAAAWMNRGNALLLYTPPESVQARDAGKRAIILAAGEEAHEPVAAEVGLKARHVLCRAIADLLAENGLVGCVREDLFTEATDTVDDGMLLARRWEMRGVTRLRRLASELFHFGARVYQAYQPHFLMEFLLESLDPERSPGALHDNQEMHAAAVEALWRTLSGIQRDGFESLNTPRFDRLLETLRELRVTEARLTELRRRNLGVGPR